MSPEFDVVETHVRNMLFSGDAEVIRIAPNERFMRSYSIDELFSINDSAYWQVISVHNFFPCNTYDNFGVPRGRQISLTLRAVVH